LKLDWML